MSRELSAVSGQPEEQERLRRVRAFVERSGSSAELLELSEEELAEVSPPEQEGLL